jgi:hypothetical protein
MIQTLFGTVEREPSLLEKLKSGVQKTRAGLVTALEDALQRKREIDASRAQTRENRRFLAALGAHRTPRQKANCKSAAGCKPIMSKSGFSKSPPGRQSPGLPTKPPSRTPGKPRLSAVPPFSAPQTVRPSRPAIWTASGRASQPGF